MNLKQILGFSAGLAFASIASAQTVDITISGSTAFRADAYRSIRSMYDGGAPALQNPVHVSNSNTGGSNIVTFSGLMTPLFGTRTVIIRTSYSGSVDGIKDVAQGNTQPFITNPDPTGGFGTTPIIPDFAFSDVYQSSTQFGSPMLTDTQCGVLPFVWVRNNACSNSVVNMTSKLAQGTFPLGQFPIGQWSGNVADLGVNLNVVGRDTSSGTRVVTLAETAYGIFTPLTQRKVSGGIYVDDNTGYGSDGSVAADLNLNAGAAISYLDLSDAGKVTGFTSPGAQLTHDGVPYSAANVQNGKYTFWSYEHFFHKSGLSTDKTTFRGAATTLPFTAGSFLATVNTEIGANTSALQIGSMNVSRLADGAVVTP